MRTRAQGNASVNFPMTAALFPNDEYNISMNTGRGWWGPVCRAIANKSFFEIIYGSAHAFILCEKLLIPESNPFPIPCTACIIATPAHTYQCTAHAKPKR